MGASGTVSLDFGAFPGATDTTLDVTATGVGPTNKVEAWLVPVATSDHSVDEHLIEEIVVSGYYKTTNTITIAGRIALTAGGPGSRSNNAHRLYGTWTVGWVWA